MNRHTVGGNFRYMVSCCSPRRIVYKNVLEQEGSDETRLEDGSWGEEPRDDLTVKKSSLTASEIRWRFLLEDHSRTQIFYFRSKTSA
jgi:hypothetical protein